MAWKQAEDKLRRKEIFEDTISYINDNETLKKATEDSIRSSKFYAEGDDMILPQNPGKDCKITLSKCRTFEAAKELSNETPGKKIAVLNFASAARPGGGVEDGAGAQEECLCRCSTLFPTLSTPEMIKVFYEPHKKQKNNLHNDDCIYSPGVVICKSDVKFPERLPESEFRTVDVITCAAPNLWEKSVKRYNPDADKVCSIDNSELYKIHRKRAAHILNIAAGNGADIVVLGAFGCGVFKNDPETVAKATLDAIREYAGYFDQIEFAIVGKRGDGNYVAFEHVLQDVLQK